jgi:hypothetical protein
MVKGEVGPLGGRRQKDVFLLSHRYKLDMRKLHRQSFQYRDKIPR